ncbi:MAG: hypothetical protein ACTSRS_21820 [Candidatus Helarchaeota archaeon]
MDIETEHYPIHYEGSYSNIISLVNFNFLGIYFSPLKTKVGRPPLPVGILFGAFILKSLMPGGVYRLVEFRLEKDIELKLSLGFKLDDNPSDSVLR